MAVAKVQVLVTLDGSGIWRVVAPLEPAYVRHLTEQELTTLSEAIPRLIESIIKERPPAAPVPPRQWPGKGGSGHKKK